MIELESRNLLRELDVVEDDKGTFDIKNSSVIDARGDVVVSLRGSSVYLSQ